MTENCYGELIEKMTGGFSRPYPALPGVTAYGNTEIEDVRKVKTIALQVLADMIESGKQVPEPLRVLFAAKANLYYRRPFTAKGDMNYLADYENLEYVSRKMSATVAI